MLDSGPFGFPLLQLTGVQDPGVVFHVGSFGLGSSGLVYPTSCISGRIIRSIFWRNLGSSTEVLVSSQFYQYNRRYDMDWLFSSILFFSRF